MRSSSERAIVVLEIYYNLGTTKNKNLKISFNGSFDHPYLISAGGKACI